MITRRYETFEKWYEYIISESIKIINDNENSRSEFENNEYRRN